MWLQIFPTVFPVNLFPVIGTDISILSVISAAVTPVVMISACGTLLINVNNRQQSLSSLVRATSTEIRSASVSTERQAQLHEQLVVFNRRFTCTWFSSCALYGASTCLLLTTLLIVWTEHRLSQGPLLPLVFFVLGLSLMLGAAISSVVEVALSRRTLQIEMRDLDLPLHKPRVTPDKPAQRDGEAS